MRRAWMLALSVLATSLSGCHLPDDSSDYSSPVTYGPGGMPYGPPVVQSGQPTNGGTVPAGYSATQPSAAPDWK